MPKYKVEFPLIHKKKKYMPGDSVELDVDLAAPLMEAKSISPMLSDDPFGEVTALDKALGHAIELLDPDKKNKADWTRSGMPQVKALAEIMGEDISAGLRDTAYKLHAEGNQ